MIKIAIVEDDIQDQNKAKTFFERLSEESGEKHSPIAPLGQKLNKCIHKLNKPSIRIRSSAVPKNIRVKRLYV